MTAAPAAVRRGLLLAGRPRRPRRLGPRLPGAVARGLLLASILSVLGVAVSPSGAAAAERPTITGPGSVTSDSTPFFSGFAEENVEVTVTIERDGGEGVVGPQTALLSGGLWSLTLTEPLPDGAYTARVTQV